LERRGGGSWRSAEQGAEGFLDLGHLDHLDGELARVDPLEVARRDFDLGLNAIIAYLCRVKQNPIA
jgi:hypothetical protein